MNKINISSMHVQDAEGLLIHQTYLKSKECNLCHYSQDLRDQFLFPVASSGTGRLLIVGQQTFMEEHKNTVAMSGPFRGTFTSYLNRFTGLSEADCTFTYSVKCTGNDTVPGPKALEYKNCSRYLLQEIKKIDPVVIVFLGKDAAKSLLSTKIRQKHDMGVPFKERILGKDRWCYFMLNPMIARSKTGAIPVVKAHFSALSKFLDKETNMYDIIPKPQQQVNSIDTTREYVLVDTDEKLQSMVKDLDQYKYIGMDTETNTLNVWSKKYKLVGISLAGAADKGYYIPINHKAPGRQTYTQLDWSIIKPIVTSIVEDVTKQTIWHNLYYDYAAMKRTGIDIFKLDPTNNIWTHDSMLMTYLYNENSRIGLKDQMYIHFNITPQKFKGVIADADVNTFEDVSPDAALQYAADDAINCLLLFNKISKLVEEESRKYTNNKLLDRIYPYELSTIKVLSEAHLLGIRIDNNYIETLAKYINEDIEETEKATFAISTTITNLGSGPKLIAALQVILTDSFLEKFLEKFEKLTAQERMLHVLIDGYAKYWDRAEKGIDSQYPGKWHPDKLSKYVNLIIQYKHLVKMKSTYIEAINKLKEQDNQGNWIIHAQIKSIGTTSGRMSSRNPNLQNIPRSSPKAPSHCNKCFSLFVDDEGELAGAFIPDPTLSRYTCTKCLYINKTFVYDLRRLYIPRPGKKFIAADYRNMELYLAAAVSGCQELYDVFLKKQVDKEDPNGDMHVVTASSILGITPDQWKEMKDSGKTSLMDKAKEARTIAKTVNFLTLYGGSAEGLYRTFLNMGMDKTKAECQEYIDAFFIAYPALRKWFDDQRYNIMNYGRLVNNYGRIRHVLKQGGEMLSAINMLIQGLGAQIVKESIVDIYKKWEDKKDWNALLVIHDENILEVPEDHLVEAVEDITTIMEVTVNDQLKVDLRIDSVPGMCSLSKADTGISL
jgi:uracil-DNA glycosylase family 4